MELTPTNVLRIPLEVTKAIGSRLLSAIEHGMEPKDLPTELAMQLWEGECYERKQ